MKVEFKPFKKTFFEAVVQHEIPICLGYIAHDQSEKPIWIFTPYEDVWFDAGELLQISAKLIELAAK